MILGLAIAQDRDPGVQSRWWSTLISALTMKMRPRVAKGTSAAGSRAGRRLAHRARVDGARSRLRRRARPNQFRSSESVGANSRARVEMTMTRAADASPSSSTNAGRATGHDVVESVREPVNRAYSGLCLLAKVVGRR